ncbi:MAG: peptidoglycan editing factor PgeF [Thermodesulfobacteriota bacterium]
MPILKSKVLSSVIHGFSTRHVGCDVSYIASKHELSQIAQLKQVHSSNIIVVDDIQSHDNEIEGDALITTLKGVGIGVRTADCVPILITDKDHTLAAAVHAGWRGSVSEIAKKTVQKIETDYGVSSSDLKVTIGPCNKKCCYEVGEDVASLFKEKFSNTSLYLFPIANSKYYLDLSIANKSALQEAGVQELETIGVCTECNPNYYSYRREGKGVGTQLSFIALPKEC